MRAARSLSASGSNLLNSGAITVGYSTSTMTLKPTHTIHAYNHHQGPAVPISHSTSATSGRPSAAATSTDFSRSAMNSRGVMRLKPKFSSTRNWRYQSNGRSAAPSTTATAATIATCPAMPLPNHAVNASEIACTPPSSVNATSSATPAAASSIARRWRAMV